MGVKHDSCRRQIYTEESKGQAALVDQSVCYNTVGSPIFLVSAVCRSLECFDIEDLQRRQRKLGRHGQRKGDW